MSAGGVRVARLDGFHRGSVTEFDGAEVWLGTDAGCEIRYDPVWDKMVSARHTVLRRTAQGWELEDRSRAGSWIDGRRVSGKSPLVLPAVLELGAGGPKLRIEAKAAQAPARGEMTTPGLPQPFPACSPASVAPAPLEPAREMRSRGPRWMAVGIAAAAVVLCTALGGVYWMVRSMLADQALAEAAARHSAAVGLVVFQQPGGSQPFGTAWALGQRVLATNAHVADPVGKAIAKGAVVHVVLNGRPGEVYRIVRAVVHEKYGQEGTGPAGAEAAVPAYDLGLLEVDRDLPVAFRIAPRAELQKLRSGYRVAFLGFPMENLAGGGVDPRNPAATMQSGIVTSLTDWWLGKADFEKALLVQHNLGATGGASGSPIFNTAGEVVAVLSAGNIISQAVVAEDGTVQLERAPSAAMINFAQRADLLETFIDKPRNIP